MARRRWHAKGLEHVLAEDSTYPDLYERLARLGGIVKT